tara:strand:+ start:3315 stop:3869 length:555 start_codon:yes stop_codon:yes gene_type:complete
MSSSTRSFGDYTQVFYKNKLIRPGWRDPVERISMAPYNFKGKTVLDLGCSIGGMLFALADKIRMGWGVDIDPEPIETAKQIAKEQQIENLRFRTLDLSLASNLEELPRTDIVFALSIAKHIKNWMDIIKSLTPKHCLFEANGGRTGGTIPTQIEWLKENFETSELLLEGYEGTRKLLFATNFKT